MKAAFLIVAALAASAPAAPPRAKPPVATDWSRTVRRTPDGNFVQGNPAARVKLVEYLSLTCPHCALFEKEAIPPLTANYIRTGRVSYEVRHAIRDPFDMAATILSRCDGPAAFFAAAPVVYAEQEAWLGKGSAWAETKPQLDGLKPDQALTRIAAGAGLDELFRRRGLIPQRQAACFAAVGEEQRLAKASDAIWQSPGFPGTPAFDINGQRANIRTWADLDAALAAALK